MRIFYDTEFLERGPAEPIVLVSIGMVREDGETYYAVNGDLNLTRQAVLRNDPWLGPNVWAHLPRHNRHVAGDLIYDLIDITHDDVKALSVIRDEVSAFCQHGLVGKEPAELWAYYADYDHVVISQLFGRMVDLPAHMPMYTRDLKQLMDFTGHSKMTLPKQDDGHHHALADAEWVRQAYGTIVGRSPR